MGVASFWSLAFHPFGDWLTVQERAKPEEVPHEEARLGNSPGEIKTKVEDVTNFR